MKSGIAILALLSGIPLAQATELLFATDTNGDLISINPGLSSSSLVGTNPDGISPIGITAQGSGPSALWVFDNGLNNFVQLNMSNANTVSTVSPVGGSDLSNDTVNEGDLVFTAANAGFVVGVPGFGSTTTAFYSFNITTGANANLYTAGTVTGDTTAGQHPQVSGLAFCPTAICAGGVLYGLEKPTDGLHLFTLSQTDGSILTSVAITGLSGSFSVGGLAINPITGVAYVEVSNLTGTTVAAINLSSGATFSPFSIPSGTAVLVDGLTFADDGILLATPEPSTALLLCLGFIALATRRRRVRS